MKIVFMGTPDFAVPSLHALTEAGYAVAAAVSYTHLTLPTILLV